MTTFTSDAIAGNMAFKPYPQGNLGVRTATYSLGAALAANDIVQMCDVFAGETVVGVILTSTDLDTGGSPAVILDVGYGGAVDVLINGTDIGKAGGTASSMAIGHASTGGAASAPVTFTADDTIDVKVATGPQTGATAGTLTMYLLIA